MTDYLLKSSLALFIFISSHLIAEPDFYGKINVSYENAKKVEGQKSEFQTMDEEIG